MNHMPRYRFVIHVPDHMNGPFNTEFPSPDAAHEHGHRIVCELKQEGYHPQGAILLVQDETGKTIHSIPF